MMNCIYRAIAPDELPKVSRQIAVSYKAAYRGMMRREYLSSLSEDHWVPILQHSLSAGGTLLVAESHGDIVGSAVFGQSDLMEKNGDAVLFAIYLLPRCVGQGVGHGLYLAAQRAMLAQSYTHCVLEVLAENHRATAFYLRQGFHQTGTFTVEENGMTLDCITMRKALGNCSD